MLAQAERQRLVRQLPRATRGPVASHARQHPHGTGSSSRWKITR
jgi:hypothetical protein